MLFSGDLTSSGSNEELVEFQKNGVLNIPSMQRLGIMNLVEKPRLGTIYLVATIHFLNLSPFIFRLSIRWELP